jgi:protein-S-isoprenylcysteine O-methyltransferase Ste14
MSIFGSFLFSFLLIIRTVQMIQTGMYFTGMMLVLQAGLVAFWMIFRQSCSREANWSIQVMAWLSSIVPFVMQISDPTLSALMSAPGLLLMLWALWSLGSSFSIAPASRSLIEHGPYRFLRHPMYAGEIVSLLGICLGSMLAWNWIVLSIFTCSIILRIFREESLVESYPIYAQAVKWRMIPGVW